MQSLRNAKEKKMNKIPTTRPRFNVPACLLILILSASALGYFAMSL